jgi:hypothetical protein
VVASIHGLPLTLVVIVAVIAVVLFVQTVGRDIGQARRRRRGDFDARRHRRR